MATKKTTRSGKLHKAKQIEHKQPLKDIVIVKGTDASSPK
jgi:hypothetical protein